ncbi:hypothetical protein FQA39_LY18840, partial [Lamprigera yunnana]
MHRMDNDLTAVITEPPAQKLRTAATFINREKSHLFKIIANIRAESLRKFYENKKKEVRKQQAELHQNIIKTGGGPPTKIENNTTDEILLSIMNQKTVSGLPFFVNSDSDGNLPVSQYEPEDIILEVNEHDGIEDGSAILTQENNYELATTSSDYPTWKKYTPANLQDPVRLSLSSATVNIESNDEGVNNVAPKFLMMEDTDEIRNHVLELIKRKDVIENEIKQLNAILDQDGVGMKMPLIDGEGFPINNINIYQVRHARQKIICLQNDHKQVMKKIESGLHRYYGNSSQKESLNENGVQMAQNTNVVNYQIPFAKVTFVDEGSPAEDSGINGGDLIVEFGS